MIKIFKEMESKAVFILEAQNYKTCVCKCRILQMQF